MICICCSSGVHVRVDRSGVEIETRAPRAHAQRSTAVVQQPRRSADLERYEVLACLELQHRALQAEAEKLAQEQRAERIVHLESADDEPMERARQAARITRAQQQNKQDGLKPQKLNCGCSGTALFRFRMTRWFGCCSCCCKICRFWRSIRRRCSELMAPRQQEQTPPEQKSDFIIKI